MYYSQQLGFSTPLIMGGVIVVALISFAIYSNRQRTASEPITSPTTSVDHSAHQGMQPVIQSHRSYTLRSDASSKSFQPRQAATYAFSIVDDQGNTLKDFRMMHEKLMHLIVVRKDLQEFQHLHPEFNPATGQFTLNDLTFSSDGQYRIFADFTPTASQIGADGEPLGVTISEDVTVGNLANYKLQSLTNSALTKTFQKYEVRLATNPAQVIIESPTMISYTISQNGKPVTNLEKYLGALGHSVVLSEGDLEFIHTHALDENVANQNGKVDFHVVFPEPGKYKLFTQFQHQGKVITTDFVVTAQGAIALGNPQSALPFIEEALAARFEQLSQNGNSMCSASFRDSITAMPASEHIKGSCCSPMNLHRYTEQVKGLQKYASIPEIPPDPYDIEAGLAQKLQSYYDITLTPEQQQYYDYAMEHSNEKGPCCCKCWRWYVYGGLAKFLIQQHGFIGEQIVDVWNLSDGCGGDSEHHH